MKPFLQLVAEDLYAKFGNNISELMVVFPNNRARIFFGKHLIKHVGKPIFSPKYTAIKELFESNSALSIEDNIRLICILYKHYKKHIEENTNELCEPFDKFYFWGEILLSDFDDVDKNLVEASQLFQNMKDLAVMKDDFEYLSEEQKSVLHRFFSSFSEERQSKLRQHFINVWDNLFKIYSDFKKELSEKKIAYEGMLYRDVIEKIDIDNMKAKKYVFIGFNVLNKCEIELFKKLYKRDKAIFYWDYDSFYTDYSINGDMQNLNLHEAGTFINQDLSLFPNELGRDLFSEFSKTHKQVDIISASTESAQARYINDKLTKLSQTENYCNADTAIVLCNEGLLLPVLHSVPDTVKDVNVTMGFPLSQTPIFSLIIGLLTIQKNATPTAFRYSAVIQLLKHPYMKAIFGKHNTSENEITQIITENRIFYPTPDFLNKATESDLFSLLDKDNKQSLTQWILHFIERIAVFHKNIKIKNQDVKTEENVLDEDLYEEALFRAYTEVKKINNLLSADEMEVNYSLLFKLLPRLLATITVPFKGEPVKGMQIMGFLETRNLDFKNVIMLSVNEGTLPKSGKDNSFIPYIIRKAYGMTTIEHKNSLYAYYFYRLIQRAENVTLLYNSAAESVGKGEKSRFIWQLQADTISLQREKSFKMNFYDIRSLIQTEKDEIISVRKNKPMLEELYKKFKKNAISPSAINTYLDCSLKFYFIHVKRLKTDDELDDEVDSAMFGTIFHEVAHNIYNDLQKEQKIIKKEHLSAIANDEAKIMEYINMAFRKIYFKLREDDNRQIEYSGEQLINIEMIKKFTLNLLEKDKEEAPFSIIGLEQQVSTPIPFIMNGEKKTINAGGIIDRYDLRNNIVNVIDYKTGGNIKKRKAVEDLFTPSKDRESKVLQAMLYAYILMQNGEKREVIPRLFFVSNKDVEKTKIEFETSDGKLGFTSKIADELGVFLTDTLTEIFNQDVPFKQADIELDKCKYCDFNIICKRNIEKKGDF